MTLGGGLFSNFYSDFEFFIFEFFGGGGFGVIFEFLKFLKMFLE